MPKALARGIAAGIVLAALAAAGPALGGGEQKINFSGPFEEIMPGVGPGTISFALYRKKDIDKVQSIRIKNMAADCDGRAAELDYTVYGRGDVAGDRSFVVRSEDLTPPAEAVVRGKFKKSFKKATGTARLHGTFNLDGEQFNCETGKQKFVATIPQ